MGHYILVEKDAKLMKKCWKWIIIGILLAIIVLCFLNSMAFHALVDNFNTNCVSSAVLEFRPILYKNDQMDTGRPALPPNRFEDENYAQKVDLYYDEFKSLHLRSVNDTDDEDTTAQPKTKLYQLKPMIVEVDGVSSTTERYGILKKKPAELNHNDARFFKTWQIDERNSNWGDKTTCEYFYYFPIVESFFAIVWIVFIGISGYRGTRSASTFIHKAWRLVLPAAVCFLVLAICSAIYAGILTNRLSRFCGQIKKNLNNTGLPCTLLINRFSLNDNTIFLPSTNFNLSRMLAWVTVVLWAMAFLVMLVRCIIGADFDVEETERYSEGTGTTLDQQPNQTSSRVKFHDDGHRYEKEIAFSPAKWSDRSTTTATTTIGQPQVPERENLLYNRK